ncbi:hypothetical protein JKP88DRAFT_250019 [Tribonema minus]|uniref:Uncharacterized protein n=1 Tax=Tribonema minus TaxID=303371 RepID=A0A835YSJ8_9STRA|nr:hypothetical protein JKP88DRAFT_250019 [Tribonema minus]
MSESVLKKQKTCVLGDTDHITVHMRPPVKGTPLIILGLYPGPRATTEISRTEKELKKLLLPGMEVAWVDLCVLSANYVNRIIDQRAIEKWMRDEELMTDYHKRFAAQLGARVGGGVSVVYIAGRTCQMAFQEMITRGWVSRICELSPLGISLCETGGVRFVTLEGRPHPSWHLVTGGEKTLRGLFAETCAMLNAVSLCCLGGDVSTDSMTRHVVAGLQIGADDLARREQGQMFMTRLLHDNDSGRFPPKHAHLRNVQAYLPAVQELLVKWRERGLATLKAVLLNGALYLNLASVDAVLEAWHQRLGTKNFVTFMCNSVAARLGDPPFDTALEAWHQRLEGRFATLICDGVAARLGEPPFDAVLETWHQRLGGKFVTLMCDGVAARLGDPALNFDAALEAWHKRLGGKFVTLMCGGVAARLGDPAFDAALEASWHKRLGGKFVTFLCDGVAARLGDPAFDAALEAWHRRLGGKFVTFLCGGVATRLGDPAFGAALEAWHQRLEGSFVTFICNGVAARLGDPAFGAALEAWHQRLEGSFVTFICNGVAARLGNPQFDAAAERWLVTLDTRNFARIFGTGGVANRMVDAGFEGRVRTHLDRVTDGARQHVARRLHMRSTCAAPACNEAAADRNATLSSTTAGVLGNGLMAQHARLHIAGAQIASIDATAQQERAATNFKYRPTTVHHLSVETRPSRKAVEGSRRGKPSRKAVADGRREKPSRTAVAESRHGPLSTTADEESRRGQPSRTAIADDCRGRLSRTDTTCSARLRCMPVFFMNRPVHCGFLLASLLRRCENRLPRLHGFRRCGRWPRLARTPLDHSRHRHQVIGCGQTLGSRCRCCCCCFDVGFAHTHQRHAFDINILARENACNFCCL